MKNIINRNFLFTNYENNKNYFILVSCDIKFFIIFSKFFINQIRKNSDVLMHFHIVGKYNSKYNKLLYSLKTKYNYLNFTFDKLNKFSIGDTSSSRYLIAKDLMNLYSKDVLISDIDLSYYFSTDSIITRIKNSNYDYALYLTRSSLPWERFAAGISFFKYKNKNSEIFLSHVAKYILFTKFKNFCFWGAETMGLLFSHANINSYKIRFLDLSKYISLDKVILKVPKTLLFKKRFVKKIF